MNEFNQFTNKQKVTIIAFAVGFIIMLFTLVQIIIWCVTDEAQAKQPEPKLYQVLRHDDDGYYVAVEVVQAEDETYVPLSFYEEEDKIVFYLPENVEGRVPNVDELVHIRMNAYGENPVVSAY